VIEPGEGLLDVEGVPLGNVQAYVVLASMKQVSFCDGVMGSFTHTVLSVRFNVTTGLPFTVTVCVTTADEHLSLGEKVCNPIVYTPGLLNEN
jgi:hypothetical protein